MQESIDFSGLVQEDIIFLKVKGDTWESLLRNIADLLFKAGAVKESYADALIERERDYPTGMPLGKFNFAIPHTFPQHIKRFAVCVAIPEHPVTFRSIENKDEYLEIHVVVCPLLSKMDDSIKMLPSLIKFFADENNIKAMVSAGSKDEVIRRITDAGPKNK